MVDRLYYADSFLRQFDATVTDIREHSRKDGVSVWQVALDRSAFYPTSGGQPHDTGSLMATAPSGISLTLAVKDVEEDEDGEVWHAVAKPLPAGTRVYGEIDWKRRQDHIQQHSGQHLLSAVCAQDAGATTVSFHLGEVESTIDLAVDSLSEASLAAIEERVNDFIAEDLAVRAFHTTAAEARSFLQEGRLRKLPQREGDMRLIEIAGLDLNACGGTHVRSLGQIGGLMLRGTEKVRQGMRVSFACGQRAVRTARRDDEVLRRMSAHLSVPREDLPTAVERKLTEAKNAAKQRQRLAEDLADYHAARLLVEDPIRDGRRVVSRQFCDRDAAYVKLLASRIVAAAPQTMALLVAREEDASTVVLARSSDLKGVHCGECISKVLSRFGLRGGGSATMAQAQAAGSKVEEVVSELLRLLDEKATGSL